MCDVLVRAFELPRPWSLPDSGQTHWSESYDRSYADVFTLQDEITSTLVSRIEPEIGFAERQRVGQLPERDLQAWECFHLGVEHFYQFTADSNASAQALLQQSRDLDPGFAGSTRLVGLCCGSRHHLLARRSGSTTAR